MIKKLNCLIILSLFIFVQSITNSLAFHKHAGDSHTITLNHEEGLNKKYLKSEYCSDILNKYTENKVIESDKPKSKPKDKDKSDSTETDFSKEEVKAKEQQEIKIDKFNIEQPHSKEFKIAPDTLDFSYVKKIEINNLRFISERLTVEKLLSLYCLQAKPEEGKNRKYKIDSTIRYLYDQIAVNNGFSDRTEAIGVVGNIYDKGKINLQVEGTELIYSEAQFITNEINNIKHQEKIDDDNERQRLADEEREKNINDAKVKGNEQWILDNKKNYLTKFKNKREEYEIEIDNLINKRAWLTAKVKDYEEKVEQVKEDIDIAFDELDNNDQEIKDRKRQIRKDKKIYLSNVDLEDFKNKLKKIKKIKFKKYENYISLNNIIKRAEKSDDAKDFVGKTGFINSLLKKLGAEPRQRGNSPGLIKEFESLENSPLGSGYKIANMDLTIRGGGSIFGYDQSGNIANIGYELVSKFINEYLENNNSNIPLINTKINLINKGIIPTSYIGPTRIRLSIYRKIKAIILLKEINYLNEELIDRFGKIPDELIRIIDIQKIYIHCQKIYISLIEEKKNSLTIKFQKNYWEQKVSDLLNKINEFINAQAINYEIEELKESLLLKLKYNNSYDSFELLNKIINELTLFGEIER